jgi:hypothetical protein
MRDRTLRLEHQPHSPLAQLVGVLPRSGPRGSISFRQDRARHRSLQVFQGPSVGPFASEAPIGQDVRRREVHPRLRIEAGEPRRRAATPPLRSLSVRERAACRQARQARLVRRADRDRVAARSAEAGELRPMPRVRAARPRRCERGEATGIRELPLNAENGDGRTVVHDRRERRHHGRDCKRRAGRESVSLMARFLNESSQMRKCHRPSRLRTRNAQQVNSLYLRPSPDACVCAVRSL